MNSHPILPLAMLGALLLSSGANIHLCADDSAFGNDNWKRNRQTER